MLNIFLQAGLPAGQMSNAFSGRLGEGLDTLVVFGEKMLWGGVTADGEAIRGANGQMLGVACALGAIFAVCVAGHMAYRSMTQGKSIDVLELMRPILIALVLANWYGLTSGLYGIVRPVENKFRSIYVYTNDRVDSLRDRRLILNRMVEGEIEEERAEAILSEVRQRYGVKVEDEEEKEPVEDGDMTENGMAFAYLDGQFADVLNDDVSDTPDDEKQGNFDVTQLFDMAMWFHWVENGTLWIAEVIWTVSVYVVFLVKYVMMYVLLMFGPIFFACSIVDIWKTEWSEWIGKFIVVCLYGAAAYLALVFGLKIIEFAVMSDINAVEYAMLDDERFESYVAKVSSLNDWGTLAMYVVAVVVTAVTIGLSFEWASLAFPGDVSRGASSFFNGMTRWIQTKAHQVQEKAKEVAVSAAVTAATGGMAAAAFVAKRMADDAESEREHERIAEADRLQRELDEAAMNDIASAGTATGTAAGSGSVGAAQAAVEPDDEWVRKAKQDDIGRQAEMEFERAMGGPQNPAVKFNRMADDAYRWADRTAYMGAVAGAKRHCIEDIMADIRDNSRLQEAEKLGIKDEFVKLRDSRLAENRFLLDMVMHQGRQTNSSLTARQKMAIRIFGEPKALKHEKLGGKDLKHKTLHGTPRLTSWGALFGLDTLSSSKHERQMLKRLGLYRHILVAEALRRLANSTLAPRYRAATKFMGITVRKEKFIYRNWMHRKLYESCLRNIATTEALIALRCRGILADRDIHINERGKAIYIPGADMHWRRDFDFDAYWQAVKRTGDDNLSDERLKWFVGRYIDNDEARKLQLELEVFEAMRLVGEADEYVMERQLKATDEQEIRLWQDMNDDYHVYRRTKDLLAKLMKVNND